MTKKDYILIAKAIGEFTVSQKIKFHDKYALINIMGDALSRENQAFDIQKFASYIDKTIRESSY